MYFQVCKVLPRWIFYHLIETENGRQKNTMQEKHIGMDFFFSTNSHSLALPVYLMQAKIFSLELCIREIEKNLRFSEQNNSCYRSGWFDFCCCPWRVYIRNCSWFKLSTQSPTASVCVCVEGAIIKYLSLYDQWQCCHSYSKVFGVENTKILFVYSRKKWCTKKHHLFLAELS